MTTTERGRAAEALAASHLAAQGYQILDQNWRNRWCELDIVARLADTVHFVEVKYRATNHYGGAAEYISRDKLARLRRAALAWNQAHSYNGPYQIDAIAIEGPLASAHLEHLPNLIID